jgi:hypothetical protein
MEHVLDFGRSKKRHRAMATQTEEQKDAEREEQKAAHKEKISMQYMRMAEYNARHLPGW